MALPDTIEPIGLLAAGWMDGIGPLILVVFWVVRQVMVAVAEQKELEKAKRAAEERGETWQPPEEEEDELEDEFDSAQFDSPPQAAGPAPPVQGDLRSEVEEFLRRAGQAAQQPAAQKPSAKPRPPQRQSIDPFDEPSRRTAPALPPRPTRPEPVVVAAPEAPAQRVKLRHLPESQLAENAAHLGESVAQSDDRVEARLHEKFDHRLGNLSARTSDLRQEPTSEPSNAAARIRKALTRPGGAREALILSEILRRPTDQM